MAVELDTRSCQDNEAKGMLTIPCSSYSVIGRFPELQPWLAWKASAAKQPILFDKIIGFITTNMKAREDGYLPTDRNDFLSKLMDLGKAGKIGEMDVITSLGANIAAGSDTTTISLSIVLYFLANHHQKAVSLRADISAFEQAETVSSPVTFQEAQMMPYLQAVLKEALRIHPATGMILARTVPSQGAMIHGTFFPGGVSYELEHAPSAAH